MSAGIVGGEIGDINHSREFPPKVVDAGFDVLCRDLVKYFTDGRFNYPLPFSIVVDKDQSKLRLVDRCLFSSILIFDLHDFLGSLIFITVKDCAVAENMM